MARLLIFSDIHNDTKALRSLMNMDADYYFAAGDLVTFQRGLDEMGEIMKSRAQKMYVIPGNHETEGDIAALCSKFGFTNFHGGQLKIGGTYVGGLGYSNPTPFNTPGEYSEDELSTRLAKFDGLSPLVMIAHAPPLDSKLDRVHEGLHAGSRAMAEFIAKNQPRDFFCGHIHEAEGRRVQIGKTVGINVGKRGYLLEL